MGQSIHIFLMANDFYSNGYGMSNASYYKPFRNTRPEDVFWEGNIETFETKFKRWLSNNSFTYQFFNFKFRSNERKQVRRDTNYLPFIEHDEIQTDCELLENYRDKFKNKRTFSLIEHAFDKSCYDQKALDNLVVLKTLDNYLTRLAVKEDFNIFYYFVPNGTFQSKEAQEFKILYGLNRNSSLTSEGMRSAIEQTIKKPVFSFEKFFKQFHGGPYYYSFDGHWKIKGSFLVADKLAEVIINN
jgi:hypothetical protein